MEDAPYTRDTLFDFVQTVLQRQNRIADKAFPDKVAQSLENSKRMFTSFKSWTTRIKLEQMDVWGYLPYKVYNGREKTLHCNTTARLNISGLRSNANLDRYTIFYLTMVWIDAGKIRFKYFLFDTIQNNYDPNIIHSRVVDLDKFRFEATFQQGKTALLVPKFPDSLVPASPYGNHHDTLLFHSIKFLHEQILSFKQHANKKIKKITPRSTRQVAQHILPRLDKIIEANGHVGALSDVHSALEAIVCGICENLGTPVLSKNNRLSQGLAMLTEDNNQKGQILSGYSKVVGKLGKYRNERSTAHGNEFLLNDEEAKLCINTMVGLIEYIDHNYA